jgi:hypothetical protein
MTPEIGIRKVAAQPQILRLPPSTRSISCQSCRFHLATETTTDPFKIILPKSNGVAAMRLLI